MVLPTYVHVYLCTCNIMDSYYINYCMRTFGSRIVKLFKWLIKTLKFYPYVIKIDISFKPDK